MEILKNPISWVMATSRSNQAVVVILIIFVLFFIYKIIKKMVAAKKGGGTGRKWSWIGTPWKIFGTIFSLGAILGVCYGFYLLFYYCRPTPEKLTFRELSRNLAENELEPEKKKLTIFNEKVKNGEILTDKEKREAMEADEKIRRVRKDYSDGKLAPLPKPVSAPVYKWVFGFKSEPEDVINAKKKGIDQISYRESDVVNKPYFDVKEIRFKYKTSKGKVIDAILDKKNPSESHFLGVVDLPDQAGKPKGRKLIIRLKETSMPDKFEGVIETCDGKKQYPQTPAFLKKVQVQ